MSKTLYLWDLADTLFLERWDSRKSGFPNFDAYIESLGFDLKTISPRDYEYAYERPYRKGLFDLDLAEHFEEVLGWTKNNAVFTTGNPEQMDWRAEQILRKYGIDPRDYIREVHSTFDYGNTNIKTEAMLKDILVKKLVAGYDTIVYTDNSRENCRFFLDAAKHLQDEGANFKTRVYNINSNDSSLKWTEHQFFEIGDLNQLLENEIKESKTD